MKLKSAVIGFHHFNIIPNILPIRIVFPLGGFRDGVLSFHCRVSKSLTNHRGVGNGQTNPWSPCLEKKMNECLHHRWKNSIHPPPFVCDDSLKSHLEERQGMKKTHGFPLIPCFHFIR